jgi:hypothetical protein
MTSQGASGEFRNRALRLGSIQANTDSCSL